MLHVQFYSFYTFPSHSLRNTVFRDYQVILRCTGGFEHWQTKTSDQPGIAPTTPSNPHSQYGVCILFLYWENVTVFASHFFLFSVLFFFFSQEIPMLLSQSEAAINISVSSLLSNSFGSGARTLLDWMIAGLAGTGPSVIGLQIETLSRLLCTVSDSEFLLGPESWHSLWCEHTEGLSTASLDGVSLTLFIFFQHEVASYTNAPNCKRRMFQSQFVLAAVYWPATCIIGHLACTNTQFISTRSLHSA